MLMLVMLMSVAAMIPSSQGMLGYRLVRSAVSKVEPEGTGLSGSLRKKS